MKPTSDETLLAITGQIVVGQTVLVAHDLGLFGVLSKGPLSLQEISEKLKITKRAAQSLATCCSSMKLLHSEDGEIYSLSKIGEAFLNQASPYYYGGALDLLIAQNTIMSFDTIKKAILTNKPQIDAGSDLFSDTDGLGNTRDFIQEIHQKALAPALHWTKLLNLNSYKQFVDIGGGSGVHSIAACLENPSLQGIVCDRKPVLPHTEDYIRKYNLEHRLGTHAINMWEDPFPKGDVYFLGDIFHDWDPERCLFLAKKCFESLDDNGIIILHEMLFDKQKTGPLLSAAYNMKMMLWTEGQQFSGAEIQNTLQTAGFVSVEIIPSLGNWSLVVGKKHSSDKR